jgi:hypothetical protein
MTSLLWQRDIGPMGVATERSFSEQKTKAS